jgi:tRNA A-37 threonylcarbamoyl transferase component Bud32
MPAMAIQPQVSGTAAFALKGHSGAELTLIEDAAAIYVRKAATRPAQNARLTEQCRKLQAAHASGIACPAVYRTGEVEGRFYFDMEFIPGETLAHAIISGKDLHWPELAAQIAALVSRLRASATRDIPEQAFHDKLLSILGQCRGNPSTAADLPALERIMHRMRQLPWSGIPHSECHGDMTLENMLLRQDDSLVFLDFDVPEHSSWLLDVGKMYQDVIGHWCLRHLALEQPGSMELLNAQMAMARTETVFAPFVAALVPGGRDRLAQLASFHLARTLPYARSGDIAGYVVRRIEAVLGLGSADRRVG